MLIRSLLLIAAGFALGGIFMAGPAKAWHYGVPHSGYHDSDEEGVIERRHRGGSLYEGERHHRPRHHRDCRQVEVRDHHGDHRVRTVCD